MQDRTGTIENIAERQDDRQVTVYAGASNQYEAYGVERIAERLHSAGIKVEQCIKDGDSNSMDRIRKLFPSCLDITDYNHVVKNIPKNIGAAFQRGCTGLRGRKVQIQSHVRRILAFIHRCEAAFNAGDMRFDLGWRKRNFE